MAGSSSGRDGRDPTVREKLIGVTLTLLAQSGPSHVKVRRVAELSGMSTMAVYHHFGGVPELLRAVVDAGFDALRETLAVARSCSSDPGVQLFAMALSVRQLAQDSPHLYDMMFGLSTRGTYRPADVVAQRDRSRVFDAAYAVFLESCVELAGSGRIAVVDGSQVAAELWSAVHGFVTLELGAHFEHFDDPVIRVLTPMAVNHFVGMGDERPRAQRSAAEALDWWTATE